MPKFLIISILLSPIFWACACASTDNCAEEWYGPTDRESMDRKNAKCLDQEKYESSMERTLVSPTGYIISEYCKESAMYRSADRKINSSK